MKIGHKLTLGYLAVAFLSLIAGIVVFVDFGEEQKKFQGLIEDIVPNVLSITELTIVTEELKHDTLEYIFFGYYQDEIKLNIKQLETFGREHLGHEKINGLELNKKIAEVSSIIKDLLNKKKSGINRDDLFKIDRDSLVPAIEEIKIIIFEHRTFHLSELEIIQVSISSSQSFGNNLIIISCVLIVTFAISISVYISKTISRPLFKLKRVAEDISRGNMDVKVDINASGDIEELAQSFETMRIGLKIVMDEYEKMDKKK